MSHAVDEHVGKRLRQLRKAQGLSQTAVADALGLTFQQVQKYERGANRVSASKLYEAANLLNVTIAAFYEGLPLSAGKTPDADILADVATDPEVARLVRLFRATPKAARVQILALIEVLACKPLGTAHELADPVGEAT